MTSIILCWDIKVELVQEMSSDTTVVAAARVSHAEEEGRAAANVPAAESAG